MNKNKILYQALLGNELILISSQFKSEFCAFKLLSVRDETEIENLKDKTDKFKTLRPS